MVSRHFVLTAVCLMVLAAVALAQDKTATEKAASQKGWDDAWSMSSALVVKNYFGQVYYPHAMALLDAEKQLDSGTAPAEFLKKLCALPGVKAAVLSRHKGQSVQFPQATVKLDSFDVAVFKRMKGNPMHPVAPMMHRTVGGKVRSAEVSTGIGTADLLVRYIAADTAQSPAAAISLVMDPKWLISQIPSAMDSLYRENSQLLFCAASPTNHLWEQSLGVVADKDTLWWTGRKDVKITNVQSLGPFSGIDVYSYVHTLEKK
ncbi:MAG TPA: hypothetical protein VGL38_16185 [bacterium]|jgi:hypothetical protein